MISLKVGQSGVTVKLPAGDRRDQVQLHLAETSAGSVSCSGAALLPRPGELAFSSSTRGLTSATQGDAGRGEAEKSDCLGKQKKPRGSYSAACCCRETNKMCKIN